LSIEAAARGRPIASAAALGSQPGPYSRLSAAEGAGSGVQCLTDFALELEKDESGRLTRLIRSVGRDKVFAMIVFEEAIAGRAVGCLNAHIELKNARQEQFMLDIKQAGRDDIRAHYGKLQSASARWPRTDALGEIIFEIVRINPDTTVKDLLDALDDRDNWESLKT